MSKKAFKAVFSVVISVLIVFSSLSLIPFAAAFSENNISEYISENKAENENSNLGQYIQKKKLPTSAGIEALRSEFELYQGKKAENGRSNDYALYSPVGTNDTNKYPLVIFVHGLMHGFTYGGQLDDSYMPYWATEELQARFDEDGAFIMLPRSSNNGFFSFWGKHHVKSLKAAIDDVIEKNADNIDTGKIIIIGSSAGGGVTRHMITAYPKFFAGAVMLCQTGFFTDKLAKDLKDLPMWIVATKNDILINYWLFQKPIFDNIRNNTNVPEKCRMTSFTKVVYPDGEVPLLSHNLCEVVTYDFQMLDGSNYPNIDTVDANGQTIDLTPGNGLIAWINSL